MEGWYLVALNTLEVVMRTTENNARIGIFICH